MSTKHNTSENLSDISIYSKAKVVAALPGSLPLGGVIENTPIFAIEQPNVGTLFSTVNTLQPARLDIALKDQMAFVIDDVITSQEADWLISISESLGYRAEAPGIATPPGMRLNKTVHWFAPSNVLAAIFSRIHTLLPARIDQQKLFPNLSHRLNMYRYERNDVFNRHIDGDWPGYGLDRNENVMVEWPQTRSKLTMLLYLNGPDDGVQGGNTRLIDRDGHGVEITPRKGSALFFRHGMNLESVMHEGCRVVGDVPKYVARINVLYET